MKPDNPRTLARACIDRMVAVKHAWRREQAGLPVLRKLEILDELKAEWEALQALRSRDRGPGAP
jgi:hypothetical protein